ncbi:MAG: hypothetical protein LBH98_07660 [Chitinispirillales bacterium]|jgi:capsule polysaccharide export protein KpsE/RkpR|nr:hypothetical protein [Chitinispirillales bacterium]
MDNEVNLLDLLIILAKQKTKIIVSGIIIAVTVFAGISFFPKYYKSQVVFLPRGNSSSMLTPFLGGVSMSDFIGENPFSKRQYIEILNSRHIVEATIEEFDLIKYYEQHKNKINPLDKTIKLLKKDIKIDIEEEGGLGITDVLSISLSVSNKNPQTAADIANFMIKKLEERSREIYSQSFAGAINFLDKQVEESIVKSRNANTELENFQKANNIYSLQTQIDLSLSTYAANLAEISVAEKQIEILQLTQSSSSSSIITLKNRISYMKKQNKKIETDGYGSIYPGLSSVIDLSDQYTQLTLNSRMYEQLKTLLLQQKLNTQIKMERDYSTIYVIDYARPAQYKYKPKRVKYCIIVLALWYAYLIPSIIIKDIFEKLPENDPTIQKITEFKKTLSFGKKR